MRKVVTEVRSGRIRGDEHDGVVRFLGIPYGADTGGANRFCPPQPVAPWSGERDAVTLGDIAMQPGRPGSGLLTSGVRMSEDCLVLNVWTPSLDGRRPVLVWIHGGGFFVGSAINETSDGAALADSGDVVVVSMNHRLGLLGFLDLEGVAGEPFEGSGNAGMLDLVAALEWVRDNIAQFGGDPEAVTIFGHSGGGAKVATLMSMPSARGLFRSAVMHGGPPFGLKDQYRATRTAEDGLSLLGIAPGDAHGIRELPATRLLELQAELGVGGLPGPDGMRFAPVVGRAALPAYPSEAFAAGVGRDIPFVTGTSLDEARYAMLVNTAYQDPSFTLTDDELLARLRPGLDDPHDAETLLERYRSTDPGALNAGLLFDILSDQFRIRTLRIAEATRAGGGTVFLYLSEANHDHPLGAFHGSEMPLFFNTVDASTRIEPTPQRRALAAAASDALVRFARTGSPSGPLAEWPEYDPTDRRQLVITDSGPVVQSDPYSGRRNAWDGILATARTDPWSRLFA